MFQDGLQIETVLAQTDHRICTVPVVVLNYCNHFVRYTRTGRELSDKRMLAAWKQKKRATKKRGSARLPPSPVRGRTSYAAIARRRRAAAPTRPNPVMSIAQLAGSGTAGVVVLKVVTRPAPMNTEP